MVDRIPNIGRVYSRPWQRGSTANPGQVLTGVAVGVRPETTLAVRYTPHGALRAPAIPPATQVAGFLAEGL